MNLCRELARNLVAPAEILTCGSRVRIKGVVHGRVIHLITDEAQERHLTFQTDEIRHVVLPQLGTYAKMLSDLKPDDIVFQEHNGLDREFACVAHVGLTKDGPAIVAYTDGTWKLYATEGSVKVLAK